MYNQEGQNNFGILANVILKHLKGQYSTEFICDSTVLAEAFKPIYMICAFNHK